MKVRSFQLSDYVAISHLLESVLSDEQYVDTMAAFARQLSWDSDLVLVAEASDEEIAGVMIGTIDQNKGYYYRMAVHAEYQGQGIGQALIQATKQRFEQRGVKRFLVPLDDYNESLLPFLKKAGFQAEDFFHSFKKLSIIAGT